MNEPVFPVPCRAGDCAMATVEDCVDKMLEETKEVVDALRGWRALGSKQDKHKAHLCEELTDVITACTTTMDVMGYSFRQRQTMQAAVNAKNYGRGRIEALI